MRFDFTYDWQDSPAGIRLPSHRATWANLKIAVDDRVFTSNAPLNSDDEDDGPRPFIAVSVFPLAEFIAANWWPLLHEPLEKEKLVLDAVAFRGRHWFNRHTDGFAYPTLGLFGADTSVRIVARPSHIESANIEFPVTSGNANVHWDGVDRSDVETALLAFLETAAERLPENDDRAWLKDMLARIHHSRTDPDEALYCRCAGLLGADPYDPGDEIDAAITRTIAILGEDIAIEMFATAETANVVERAEWMRDQTRAAIQKSRELASHANALKHQLREAMPMAGKPWERGYATARYLRVLLDMTPDTPIPTANAVSTALLAAPASMISSLEHMEASCGARGIAIESGDGLGMATQGGRTPQFQIAATFADFLFAGNHEFFLSTAAATDRQKCNRAFAAEFLAPIAGIQEQWSKSKSAEANIADIAKSFGISRSIARYQVQNQAEHLLAA